MQNEVQLIVKAGQVFTGDVIEPSTSGGVNKIGVNFFAGIESLVGSPITIIEDDGTEHDGGLIYQIDFGSTYPGLWNIYFPDSIVIDWSIPTVTFRIDGSTQVFLDLYPNESISLSYQFTDLNNFSQIGTFSRDFRVPATKRNVEALGPLYDYNFVDDVLSFSRKYEAELRVDTIPISRGYLRIMAAYKQQDYLSDFQVAFYSQAPNFVKAIGDKKLKDITDLNNLNEDINFSNVTSINSNRIWALIDRAINEQALSDLGETNTQPTQTQNQYLWPHELTPCLRADYLLTEIFKDAGYELDASALLTIIQDYYVPWLLTQKLITAESWEDYNFKVESNVAIAYSYYNNYINFNSSVFGGANFDLPNDRFINLYSDVAIYEFRIAYTQFFGVFELRVFNASNVLQYSYPAGNAGWLYTDDFGNTTVNYGYGFNDVVNVALQPNWYVKIFAAGYAANNGIVSLTLSNAELIGGTIVYPFNAPDIKQIDFVSDIIKMHNLAVIPDLNIENKLKLEPMQTYIGSGSTLDWTKKLDISKDIVIKGTDDIRKKQLLFTYSPGQDTYSKLFVDQGRTYGDYKPQPYVTNVDQIPSVFAQGETTVKLVAQSTPATLVGGTNLIAPRFWTQSGDEPPQFATPGLRFLYWSDTLSIYLYDTSTFTSVYQNVPIVTHYSDTSGSNPDYNGSDLNFAPETPLHDYTANPFNNLFTLYWRDYLDTIYGDDARIMEANFALDNTDILTLNFADYIFVKDAYWRVLELSDYKMGQYESTRVKLLKMNPGVPPVAQCNLKPDTVNPDGSVNFLNLSGNPVSATEKCCLAYNYTWSDATNLCYARPSDRPSGGTTGKPSTPKGDINNFNPINSGTNNVINTIGLDAGASTYSIYSGQNLKSEGVNNYNIMVGDTIKLKGDQRGAAMFGKSIESVVPGLVIGGGWPQDDRTYAYNGAQSAGTFIMSNDGTYAATLGTLELFIEGIANKRIELEDDTVWYIRMQVMVQPTINQYINATITAQMGKTGGLAFATAPIVQYQDTSMAGRTVALIIDTATNTAQHRLNIQLAGGSYPFVTRLLAQINYTQFR